jgi:hypothetical protein
MLAAKLCGIVKLLRHIIYDRNKADVEISSPIKIYAQHPGDGGGRPQRRRGRVGAGRQRGRHRHAGGPAPAAPSAAPSTTAGPDPPDVHTDSADANTDKVNDLVANMSPARKSVDNSNLESDFGSGYQESESENLRNSLFNYWKYGTCSKVGEGETLIESEKPVMPSTYYQCKSARHALRNNPTVDVSIGPSAGVSENVKHSSVGSFECHGKQRS